MAAQGAKKTVAKQTESLAALEAEALEETTVTIEFRGETLTVDREDLDDYELLNTLSRGVPMIALNALVPDADQQARLLDTCDKNRRGAPKLSSVMTMVTELMEAVGAGK